MGVFFQVHEGSASEANAAYMREAAAKAIAQKKLAAQQAASAKNLKASPHTG